MDAFSRCAWADGTICTEPSAAYAETPDENRAVGRRKTAACSGDLCRNQLLSAQVDAIIQLIAGVLSKDKRAALYLRVSTADQTVSDQRVELEAAAAARGWTVVATYSDEGIRLAMGARSSI